MKIIFLIFLLIHPVFYNSVQQREMNTFKTDPMITFNDPLQKYIRRELIIIF